MTAHLSPEEYVLVIKHLETDKNRLIATTQQTTQELDRYRLMTDNASDLIHSVTPEGVFLYTNKAWRDTLGYTQDEIHHLSLLDIIAPDFKDNAATTFTSLLNGERIDRRNTSFISKDGTTILVEGRCSTHFENNVPLFVTGIFRDITAQTHSQQALLESERKYKNLFENSSNLIQMVNPDGRLLYVNRGPGVKPLATAKKKSHIFPSSMSLPPIARDIVKPSSNKFSTINNSTSSTQFLPPKMAGRYLLKAMPSVPMTMESPFSPNAFSMT